MITAVGPDTSRIIVSLTGLRFLDSAGLHTLLKAHKRLAREERELVLVNPRPNIAKVFDLTGTSTMFHIYPTLASAVADG